MTSRNSRGGDGAAGANESEMFAAAEPSGAAEAAPPARRGGFEDSLFAEFEEQMEIPHDPGEYQGILTEESLDALIAHIRTKGRFTFDTETATT